MKRRKLWSLSVLALCVTAALVFRQFAFVSWYPVGMSTFLALAFGLSLFTRPLCLTMAETLPPHLLPPGAEKYCRRLTAIWCLVFVLNGLVALSTVFAPRWVWFAWNCALSYAVMGAMILGERLVRKKVFSMEFHTSGSTAAPKRIVKTFDMLAAEVVFHRDETLAGLLTGSNAQELTILGTIEGRHMYGMLWKTLLKGAVKCKVDDEIILAPETLLAKMRSSKRVMLVTTPGFLAHFTAYADEYDVPKNCVEIITSGSLLTREVAANAKRVFGVAPLEIFGSTETGGVAWRRQDGENKSVYDWQVFSPVKISLSPEGGLVVDSPFSFQRAFEMGDGAELSENARSFKLLPRRDRVVKIAEVRLSLSELEDDISRLPGVREAALVVLDGAHSPVLGVVMAMDPAALGAKAMTRSHLALALRRRLLPIFPKGTLPRRCRFVRELPRNPQGKVKASALRELFASRFPEPLVLSETRTSSMWEAQVVFPADDAYFKGHFPGFALVPGVVQLGAAERFASALRSRSAGLRQVRKMKFSAPMRPGERLRLRLEFLGETTTEYTYFLGDKVCASGVMEW